MAVPVERKAEATEALLAGLDMPGGAAWAREAREAALGRLRGMGVPHRRDEYWRFTDPAALIAPEAPMAALGPEGEAPIYADLDALQVVFVDGVFDAGASSPLQETGLEITRLADAAAKDIHWIKDFYGKLEVRAHQTVPRPMAALNSAFASDGLVIRVTHTPKRPVHLRYLHRDETSDAILRHLVKLEPGTELTLIESGPAGARLNMVTEAEVADGARLHHIRTQGRDHERRAATALFATLGQASTLKSFTLTVNGRLTRNEVALWFEGDDGVAHIAGAALGDGADDVFHHDDTVFVTHDAVGCESRQVFKKVLKNGATGVFQGKILVKPGAQKTDGYQISQALLLDGDANFLAKPELEIYADDVVCSHGSTSGGIDETALFYLRSRGVGQREAENLLTLAFLAEALLEVEDEALAAGLQTQLEAWLARHR